MVVGYFSGGPVLHVVMDELFVDVGKVVKYDALFVLCGCFMLDVPRKPAT